MKNYLIVVFVFFLLFNFSEVFASENNMGIGLIMGYHEPSNSSDSYKAVYDSGDIQFGIMYDYRVIDWLVLDLRIMRFGTSGNRVTIGAGGDIIKTDHPEDLEIISITAGARYVFGNSETIAPYIGLSIGNWNMTTESTIGAYKAKFDNSGFGAMFMAGAQLFPRNKFSLCFDINYSSVPDMIGDDPNSASYYYGDSDIGGLSVNLIGQFRF